LKIVYNSDSLKFLSLHFHYETTSYLSHFKNIDGFLPLFYQAQEKLACMPLAEGWGAKHILFAKWKLAEAKVKNLFQKLITCISRSI
jgi:hypothetical protein